MNAKQIFTLGAVVTLTAVLFAGCIVSNESDAAITLDQNQTYGETRCAPHVATVSNGSAVPGMTFYGKYFGGMYFMCYSGTPTVAGNYTINTDQGSFDVTVRSANSPDYTHTVVYNANGGSGSMANTVVTDKNSGSSNVTLASNGFTAPADKKFAYWSTSASNNGSVTSVSVGGNSSVTVYAIWTYINPTLDLNVGTALYPDTRVMLGYLGNTVTNIPGLTFSYQHDGAPFVVANGTPTTPGIYTFTATETTGENITVKVIVKGTHTVAYNANGGSGAPGNQTVSDTNPSTTMTLSTAVPTRDGYTFDGWYTAASGGTKVTSVTVGTNATTTVYAHWNEKKVTVGSVAQQNSVIGNPISFSATSTSNPAGASVTYSATNVQSGLNVSVSGSTVTCSSNLPGTYTFTLNGSASGYTGGSTTVTVQFVPVLAFTNTPSAGALNA